MTTLLEPPARERTPVEVAEHTAPRPRLADRLRPYRHSAFYLVPLLVLTTVVSRIGMGGSPQRIDDEGTYTAQAFAVERFGELAHYTYWYDHPPLGWIQIAGWTWLTNGFDRYELSVLAGREAMIVAHVVSAALLWLLARRLDLGRPAAAAVLVIYALSPLALQFTRTVYLDNVATPWLLASFVLALSRSRQLLAFAGAALCFAVACLTKETYLLMLPFLAWQVWRASDPATRRYTLTVASSLLVLGLGGYGLFALVKGEVVPGQDRVSLWDGIVFQLAGRESSGSVLDAGTQSGSTLATYLDLDAVLLGAALVAGVVGLFMTRLRPFAAALLFSVAVMFRPGYLPVPYVIVMLPLAALLVVAVLEAGIRAGVRRGSSGLRRGLTVTSGVTAAALVAAAVPAWAGDLRGLWLADLDRPMREAQTWITDNVPTDDRLLVDDAVWTDLVSEGRDRDDVVWYYKADQDSDVSDLAPNGWRDYDWVLVTQSIRRSAESAPTVAEALDNSTRTAVFGDGENAVEVYRVNEVGATAYDEAQQRDRDARSVASRSLLDNPGLELSAPARAQLEAGQVDSRLVSLLALTAADRTLEVADFPAVLGEDGQVPLRTVEISGVDGEPVDSTGGEAFASQLDDQVGDFEPAEVTVDGGVVTARFGLADPTDLLPEPVG